MQRVVLDLLQVLVNLLLDLLGPQTLPPILLAVAPLFLSLLLFPVDPELFMRNVLIGALACCLHFRHTIVTLLVEQPCVLVIKCLLVVVVVPLLVHALLQPCWLLDLREGTDQALVFLELLEQVAVRLQVRLPVQARLLPSLVQLAVKEVLLLLL